MAQILGHQSRQRTEAMRGTTALVTVGLIVGDWRQAITTPAKFRLPGFLIPGPEFPDLLSGLPDPL